MSVASLEAAARRGYPAALRWLRNPDEARDACQEAMTRAWAARGRYDPARPFYPWFYRILKNYCLDRIGSRAQRAARDVELLEQPSSNRPGAEEKVLEVERAGQLQSALTKLPDELREIIELRHFQDASYREIADILNVPQGTVMSRLYRARRTLRTLMEEEA